MTISVIQVLGGSGQDMQVTSDWEAIQTTCMVPRPPRPPAQGSGQSSASHYSLPESDLKNEIYLLMWKLSCAGVLKVRAM